MLTADVQLSQCGCCESLLACGAASGLASSPRLPRRLTYGAAFVSIALGGFLIINKTTDRWNYKHQVENIFHYLLFLFLFFTSTQLWHVDVFFFGIILPPFSTSNATSLPVSPIQWILLYWKLMCHRAFLAAKFSDKKNDKGFKSMALWGNMDNLTALPKKKKKSCHFQWFTFLVMLVLISC